jgi:hypothetical protein
VRGFVVHEVMGSFLATYSYAEAFDGAIEIFITGISALSARDMAASAGRKSISPDLKGKGESGS